MKGSGDEIGARVGDKFCTKNKKKTRAKKDKKERKMEKLKEKRDKKGEMKQNIAGAKGWAEGGKNAGDATRFSGKKHGGIFANWIKPLKMTIPVILTILLLALIVAPLAYLVFSNSGDLIFTNMTESSSNGARLSAAVLSMDFNNPAENILNLGYQNASLYESGTYIKDGSIYNNYGTSSGLTKQYWWNGNTPGASKINGSLQFDGVDDYVSVPFSQAINITGNQLTISAWVNGFNSTSAYSTRTIVGRGNNNDGFDPYYLSWRTGNLLQFAVRNTTNSTFGDECGVYKYFTPISGWHHILAVYNQGNASIYVDGTLFVNNFTCSGNGSYIRPYNTGVNIGSGGGTYFWNGSIDDVIIWGRALNSSEISTIYNEGVAGRTITFDTLGDDRIIPSDTRNWWNFNTNQTTTKTDTYGLNNATCTDCPAWQTDGAYNSSYYFNGVNNYLVANQTYVNLTSNNYSMNIWVKRDVDGAESQESLMSVYSASTGFRWQIHETNTNGFTLRTWNESYYETTAIGRLIDSKWHMITATRNGLNDSIYLDGVYKYSATGAKINTTDGQIFIGTLALTTYNFQGSLDEPMFFNRTLTSAEVINLYGQQKLHLPLDELSGTTATNIAGSVTSGNLTNYPTTATTAPVWNATGGVNGSGAYVFDGVDDRIQINNVNLGTGSFTTSAWLKIDAPSSVSSGVFYKSGSSINIYRGTDNTLTIFIGGFGSNYGTVPYNSQNWQHLAVRYDTSGINNSERLKVYLNGAAQTVSFTGTIPSNISDSASNPIYLGIGYNAAAYLNGSLDNVLFFNRALSASEILNLYNGTNANRTIKYSTKQGDFTSGVFYNTTSTYWNVSLATADTTNRSGIVNPDNSINLSNPNLVSYWALDGNYLDTKGRNNGTGIGVINNATGISSNAIKFDGSTGYINISKPSLYTQSSFAANGMTMSIWFTCNDVSNPSPMTLMAGADAVGNLGFPSGGIRFTDGTVGNPVEMEIYDGSYKKATSPSISCTPTTWHHTVARFGYDGNMSLFVDGIKVANSTFNSSNCLYGTPNIFKIGGLVTSATYGTYFNGIIDEPIIFNSTLTNNQIQQLYKSGLSQHANTNVTIQTRTANNYNLSDPSLVGFWALNNDSSIGENSTKFVDLKNGNNGTCIGATCPTANFSGVVNMAMKFSSSLINLTDTANETTNQFTISLWALKSGNHPTGNLGIAASRIAAAISARKFDLFESSGTYTFEVYNSSTTLATSYTAAIPNGVWVAVTGMWNGTNSMLYINGKLVGNTFYGAYTLNTGNASTMIGNGYTNGNYYWNGSIDEVRIYNRSLSAAEVLDLYNLGSTHISDWSNWTNQTIVNDGVSQVTFTGGKFFQFKNSLYSNTTEISPYVISYNVASNGLPANLTINSPTNATITNNSIVNFTANISSGVGVANATLTIVNSSNASQIINQTTTIYGAGVIQTTVGIVVNMVNGIFNWFYSMIDNMNNLVMSGNRTITIDTIYPKINFTSPTPASGTTQSLTSLIVNMTTSDAGPIYSFVDLGLMSWFRMETINDSLGINNLTCTGLQCPTLTSTGKFGSAYSFDAVNNYLDAGSSTNLNFTSGSNFTLSAWINMAGVGKDGVGNAILGKSNASGTGYKFYVYNNSQGLYFQTDSTNITSNYQLNFSTWYQVAYTRNSSGQSLFVNGNQVASAGSPTLAGSASNFYIGSYTSTGLSLFNGTIDEVLAFNRSLSANEIKSLYDANANQYYNSIDNISQGSYNYTGYVVDQVGNLNQTEKRLITINNQPPVINFTSPSEISGSYINRNNIQINASANSTSVLSNITVYLYNSTSLINQTLSATTPNFVNIINLSDGIYFFNASAYDITGTGNFSITKNVTIDTVTPLVNFVSPTLGNNSITSMTNYIINSTIVESNFNNLTYNWNGANYSVFDGSLVAMYNLNNNSALGENATNFVDVSGKGNNGVCVSCPTLTTGKFGNAYLFDGISNTITTNTNILNGTSAFTISVWANPTSFGGWKGIVGKGTGDTNVITIQAHTGGMIYADVDNGTTDSFVNSAAGVLTLGNWYLLTLVYNGSGATNADKLNVFVNGANISLTYTGTIPASTGSTNLGIFYIGQLGYANNYFNGAIDDVRIYNRSLSSSEVNQLYMTGLQKINPTTWNLIVNQSRNSTAGLIDGVYTYYVSTTDSAGNSNQTDVRTITIDATSPNATLISPGNNTYTNNQTQNYTANLSDNLVGIRNATLNIYNNSGSLVNQTNVSYVQGTLTTTVGIVVNLADGIYNWFYNLFDWAGNNKVSSNNTLTIDTVNPLVYALNPQAANNYNIYDVVQIAANITESYGVNSVSVNITYPNSVSQIIVLNNAGGNKYNNSFTAPNMIGRFNVSFRANDTTGNLNNTENTYFIVNDNILPNATFILPSPTNGSTKGTNTTLFNVEIRDNIAVDSCILILDGNNYSMQKTGSGIFATCNNSVSNLANGAHSFRVFVNDSSGNINYSESRSYIIDTNVPNVDFALPTESNGIYLARRSIVINGTATTSGAALANITIRLYNSTSLVNETTSLTSPYFINITNLADNIYWFNVTGDNILGVEGRSETRFVTLDITPAVINYNGSTLNNGVNVSQNFVYINVSVIETNEANITFRLYNATTNINTTIMPALTRTINFTNLADGSYSYNVSVTDLANNVNTSLVRNITLDVHAPNATLLIGNNSYLNNQTENLTASLSDNLGLRNATLNVFNQTSLVNQTTLNFGGGVVGTTVGVVVNLMDGVYNWFYNLFDWAGNNFVTQNNTLTIDTLKPGINFVGVFDGSGAYVPRSNILINASINDINPANITINLYNSTDLVNTSFFSGANGFVNVSGLAEGIYYYNATFFDKAGNKNDSLTNNVTVDTTYPLIDYSDGTASDAAGFTQNNLFINVSVNELNEANVTFNIYNSTGLVNATTLNASNREINFTNLANNIYAYNVTLSDLAGNKNTTATRTIILETNAPRIANLTITPNSTDRLDPGVNVTFNANVDVDSFVSLNQVILEYFNGVSWNNLSMVKLTGNLYQANLTLVNYEANYNYSVFAVDNLGNSNRLNDSNFSSYWDCTWTLTPATLPETSGFNERKNLGSIIINNTGDVQYANNNCSLFFGLTSNLPGRIFYDNQDTLYAYLTAGSTKTVNVAAQFLTAKIDESLNIYANETTGIASVKSRIASAIMITASGNQPYLYETIETPSSAVTLDAHEFSLTGYLRNLVGDGSLGKAAYDVNFNWTLPSGFLIKTGVASTNYDIILDNAAHYNNLAIELNSTNLPSMVPGTYLVYLYARGENSTGSPISNNNNQTVLVEVVNLTLTCSLVKDGIAVAACGALDGDYVAPTTSTNAGAGGGGGGSGSNSNANRVEKSEATYELLRGGKQTFVLQINNKYDQLMEGIGISVSGLNSEYIAVYPNSINSLNPGQSKNVTVTISAPGYFTGQKYNLIFDITGNLIANDSGIKTSVQVTDKRYVTLYIVEVERTAANNDINQSEMLLDEMNKSGLVTRDIQSLLITQQKAYGDLNFLDVKNIYEQIKKIRDNAFESKQIIDELTAGIKESEKNGVSVTESKKSLYLAEVAFARGDYSIALSRLKEAKLVYALEVKGEFNLIYAIKNNPGKSFGAIIFAGLFGWGSSLVIRLRLYKRKFRTLGEEEILLLELMKMVQRQCFEDKKLSMEEYDQAMVQYEAKLTEAIEDRIRVETKIANLLNIRGKRKALDQEKARLIELIRKAQDDYLNKNKIETRIYEGMVKSYSGRLSEVDEQLAYLEAQEALKKQEKMNSMFKV